VATLAPTGATWFPCPGCCRTCQYFNDDFSKTPEGDDPLGEDWNSDGWRFDLTEGRVYGSAAAIAVATVPHPEWNGCVVVRASIRLTVGSEFRLLADCEQVSGSPEADDCIYASFKLLATGLVVITVGRVGGDSETGTLWPYAENHNAIKIPHFEQVSLCVCAGSAKARIGEVVILNPNMTATRDGAGMQVVTLGTDGEELAVTNFNLNYHAGELEYCPHCGVECFEPRCTDEAPCCVLVEFEGIKNDTCTYCTDLNGKPFKVNQIRYLGPYDQSVTRWAWENYTGEIADYGICNSGQGTSFAELGVDGFIAGYVGAELSQEWQYETQGPVGNPTKIRGRIVIQLDLRRSSPIYHSWEPRSNLLRWQYFGPWSDWQDINEGVFGPGWRGRGRAGENDCKAWNRLKLDWVARIPPSQENTCDGTGSAAYISYLNPDIPCPQDTPNEGCDGNLSVGCRELSVTFDAVPAGGPDYLRPGWGGLGPPSIFEVLAQMHGRTYVLACHEACLHSGPTSQEGEPSKTWGICFDAPIARLSTIFSIRLWASLHLLSSGLYAIYLYLDGVGGWAVYGGWYLGVFSFQEETVKHNEWVQWTFDQPSYAYVSAASGYQQMPWVYANPPFSIRSNCSG